MSSREEVENAKEKLSKEIILGKTFSDSCSITSFVRIGNIFEDIGDVAAELGISLIFMGTHKASRWQKLVGSRAIKVITSSPVPFIVAQEKLMNTNGYDNIVVPSRYKCGDQTKAGIGGQNSALFRFRSTS